MSKKKIANLVTHVKETEEFNALLEECPKHLLGKYQLFKEIYNHA